MAASASASAVAAKEAAGPCVIQGEWAQNARPRTHLESGRALELKCALIVAFRVELVVSHEQEHEKPKNDGHPWMQRV